MRSLPLRLRLAVLCSGASALVYEVVWTRALCRHFGASAPAVTTLVATFMAGMSLGAWIFGPLADRSREPFRLYRRIEGALAISALALSLLLLRGDPVLEALASWSELAGTFSGLLHGLAFALLLLGPSTLIGATLIVLARAVALEAGNGAALGALYALNLLGALLGALSPDFVAIPALGLTATAAAASCGNVLAALLALGLDPEPQAGERNPAPRAPADSSTDAGRRKLALAIYALIGFAGMALEVLWSRVLEHWAAALVTSFAVLLAIYLGAVAAGSWWARRWADRVQDPLAWATALALAIGPVVIATLAAANVWRDLERAWLPRPEGVVRASLFYETLNASLHALYLEAAPCFLMGAVFPPLAAASVRVGRSGRQTGRLYAVNTAAGVFGSIVAGFVWLPALGEQYAFAALAVMLVACGGALALSRAASWLCWTALAAVSCVALALFALPGDALQRAHFRGAGHLIALQEGPATSAAVAQRFRFGLPHYRELLTPGVSMSDTSLGARRYMGLMGQLASFFSARPERALLICYGAGNTADALLSQPDLARLDVVDLAPEVLALSPQFAGERGRDPLRDPRTRVFADDGRHHLIAREVGYDVITSEPPPPNYAGVVNLYSREYYRLAKRRLRPGGVFSQWLPAFQLSDADSRAIVAAFRAEFSHAALFYGHEAQWILVGSQAPLQIDPERWRARAALPSVAQKLRAIGVASEVDLYAALLFGGDELSALSARAEPLRDDAPSIEYPRTAVRAGWHPARPAGVEPRALALLSRPLAAAQAAALSRASEQLDAIYEALPQRALEPIELWEARYATRLAERAPGEPVMALLGTDADSAALASRALALDPNWLLTLAQAPRDPPRSVEAIREAVTCLARRALYAGHVREAEALLRQLPEALREPHHEWLMAMAALRQNQFADAEGHLERAAAGSRSQAFIREVQRQMPARTASNTAQP